VNVITEKHLTRHLGELLHRVEAGEKFIVVADGRAIALLEPMGAPNMGEWSRAAARLGYAPSRDRRRSNWCVISRSG
jgi:antitoxin (DNA-binding transcriptional repressor) of toxin-antitoxin stability system